MPPGLPPNEFDGQVRAALIPTGTVLYRVHEARRPAHVFNPTPAPPAPGGGRFDGTAEHPCRYLYAAPRAATAVVERLVRSREFDGTRRLLNRTALRGMRLSAIEVRRELRLVSLVSAVDLATVCQDDWLVQAPEREFGLTRAWAPWLRERDPTAAGLVWQSRRDRPHTCLMLYADLHTGLGNPGGTATNDPATTGVDGASPVGVDVQAAVGTHDLPHLDLDSPAGHRWLNSVLRPYRTQITSDEPAAF